MCVCVCVWEPGCHVEMNFTRTTLVLESTTLYCICVGFNKRIAGRAQKECYCISCSESLISINTSIQVSANHGDIALHFYHFYKNKKNIRYSLLNQHKDAFA